MCVVRHQPCFFILYSSMCRLWSIAILIAPSTFAANSVQRIGYIYEWSCPVWIVLSAWYAQEVVFGSLRLNMLFLITENVLSVLHVIHPFVHIGSIKYLYWPIESGNTTASIAFVKLVLSPLVISFREYSTSQGIHWSSSVLLVSTIFFEIITIVTELSKILSRSLEAIVSSLNWSSGSPSSSPLYMWSLTLINLSTSLT